MRLILIKCKPVILKQLHLSNKTDQ